jgi:hypothetical protein
MALMAAVIIVARMAAVIIVIWLHASRIGRTTSRLRE